MLNYLLNTLSKLMFGEGLEKESNADMPFIRFTVSGIEITERIVEYGYREDGLFYVQTDTNKVICIADEVTHDQIHYSDSSQIINLGGELEKEYPKDLVESLNNQNDIA